MYISPSVIKKVKKKKKAEGGGVADSGLEGPREEGRRGGGAEGRRYSLSAWGGGVILCSRC